MTRRHKAGAWGLLLLPLALALSPAPGATGGAGQRLTVSQADGLSPDGQTVTVTGSGYDPAKGVYVAFCVLPKPGELPTPCGGGVDMSGASGSSKWISSNPPKYGEGLAQAYGAGGSFTVQLKISPVIGVAAEGSQVFDCREVACAVVTRADHTRTADRTQDVFVPVTFSGGFPTVAVAAGGGGVLLLGAAASAVVVVRRRRRA
ncbi:hypothetical protein FXF51_21600 [Nonomuraea sp. PA05]|uniref:hypothetical protein n=1 Tax=Nonomuraea sp. PA05 TaxID=2604466 RepID=UPI0011D96D3A|nr:hypothetical protein [Nonomuraea sp. PA05]TYB64321.1 hypothetical protein FXF51_21600 [Nonomuraea sp. PA05]